MLRRAWTFRNEWCHRAMYSIGASLPPERISSWLLPPSQLARPMTRPHLTNPSYVFRSWIFSFFRRHPASRRSADWRCTGCSAASESLRVGAGVCRDYGRVWGWIRSGRHIMSSDSKEKGSASSNGAADGSEGSGGEPKAAANEFDKLFGEYLRRRGFEVKLAKDYEAGKESATKEVSIRELASEMRLGAHTQFMGQILQYSRAEASPAVAYTAAYDALRRWVDSSLDIYRRDLQKILWPLVMHVFLELIRKRFPTEAHKFLEAHVHSLKKMKTKQYQRLAKIHSPKDIEESNDKIIKLIIGRSKGVQLSQFSLRLLLSFLEQSGHMVLTHIFNKHLKIDVCTRTPLTLADMEAFDGPDGSDGGERGLNDKNSKAEYWGVLSREAELHRNALEQGFGGVHETVTADAVAKAAKQEGGDGDTKVQAADAKMRVVDEDENQQPLLPGVPKESGKDRAPQVPPLSDSAKRKRLEELRKRAKLTSTALPSVCFYTFLNAETTNTVSISEDGDMASAGFADSSVRVWSLKARAERLANDQRGSRDQLYAEMSKAPRLDSKGDRIVDNWPAYAKYVGHSGPVFRTAISNDKHFLLSASQDSSVRLWNNETSLCLAAYKGHNFPVWDVAFAPVGFYFATGSLDRTARLWVTEREYPVRVFAGHDADVDSVIFHPNCNLVATGSLDKTVRVWDVQSGEAARLFRGHTKGVRCLAISPNGRVAASGAGDNSVILWDLPEGKQIARLEGHGKDVLSVAFSDDGGTLATGGQDNTICLWDVKRADGLAKPLRRFQTKSTPVSFLRFTKKNLLLASGVFRPTAGGAASITGAASPQAGASTGTAQKSGSAPMEMG